MLPTRNLVSLKRSENIQLKEKSLNLLYHQPKGLYGIINR